MNDKEYSFIKGVALVPTILCAIYLGIVSSKYGPLTLIITFLLMRYSFKQLFTFYFYSNRKNISLIKVSLFSVAHPFVWWAFISYLLELLKL